jgi:hypothetical protein
MQRSEVDDDVGRGPRDRAPEGVCIAHIELVQLGVSVKPVATTARKVVNNRDMLAEGNQPLDEMAADESGSAADKDSPRHHASACHTTDRAGDSAA